MSTFERVPSGLPGLDKMLDHIRMGDNVVWQVLDIQDYLFFVTPYYQQALQDGRQVLYMHFKGHPMLLEEQEGLAIHTFDPSLGFEPFTMDVRKVIEAAGRDAFYVFDCLSNLQNAWSTDLMMGNFFQVTCPYLFELNTVAYFPILRGRHSFDAIARIQETTQLFLDVYMDDANVYVNPLKVWNRYSPNMFLPHVYQPKDGSFLPLKGGYEVSQFYALVEDQTRENENQNLDSWERFVTHAQHQYRDSGELPAEVTDSFERNMMSEDPHIRSLLDQYFTPEDYFRVYNRMIGTGSVGGKACGMLLARKIIESDAPDVMAYMEPHDSYYLGSDVFYTYIVHNKFWRLHIQQKTSEGYFPLAKDMEQAFKNGVFPESIRQQLMRMLDYFGQWPIIVRSSSLQEDGFGNAFAGKYESVFCMNSGSMEDRLNELEEAIRTVYASTMNTSALEYRMQRGLVQKDEQMALLIQRVSGSLYDDFIMPSAAGVGYSYCAYRWSEEIDPAAGMLRLVMGLGTRAVDRTEGDYPRLVNLDNPTGSSLTESREKHQFSQRYVDLLDYDTKTLTTRPVAEVTGHMAPWYQRLVLEHDLDAERTFRERGAHREILFASCEGLVHKQELMACMKTLLHTLQEAYQYPVDIEFTMNASESGDFYVNLLQCRPLQIGSVGENVRVPEIEEKNLVFSVVNSSMGGSRAKHIDGVVWIDTKGYSECPYKEKAVIARVVGEINRYYEDSGKNLILFTPGRIGTSSPELGLPVSFAEIHHFCAICEMSDTEIGYMPELSYGSHMFQDLVEAEIFYTAIFANEKTLYFNKNYFDHCENILGNITPKYKEYEEIVKVYDIQDEKLTLYSDVQNKKTVLGT